MDTQVAPFFLEAARAKRPAPEITPLGYIFHATDTLETFVRAIDPVTNLPRWDLIGGGSSGFLSSKYWVNAAGQVPVTGFTTVQSAVNAAVADGHGPTNPAVICILPGTYVEDVTLAAGISLFAVVNGFLGTALIQGNVDASLISSGTNSLSNIAIIGGFSAQHLAATTQVIFMDNLFITNSAGTAVSMSGDGLTFIARQCAFDGDPGRGLDSDDNISGDVRTSSIVGSASGMRVTGGWTFTNCSFKSGKGPAVEAGITTGGVNPSIEYHNCEWLPGNGQVAFNDGSAAGLHLVFAPAFFNVVGAHLFNFGAGVRLQVRGSPFLGSYTVANLPSSANLVASNDAAPQCYAINGRKVGQGPGAGTGVPCYFDPNATAWLVFSTDAAVSA